MIINQEELNEMGSIGQCPYCNKWLIIDKNIDLPDCRICEWKCPKCFMRFEEVLLVK